MDLEVGTLVIFERESHSPGHDSYYLAGRLALLLPEGEWLIQPNSSRMSPQRVSIDKIWLAPDFMHDSAYIDRGDF